MTSDYPNSDLLLHQRLGNLEAGCARTGGLTMTTHKLTKRAESMFPRYSGSADACVALRCVALFAAQNPGLEFGNYCSGWSDKEGRAAYFSEARRITRDLGRVRDSMRCAYYARVTDDDMIEAARHAFCGRLQVRRTESGAISVDYCAGQYWPTEYRRACVAVLDEAVEVAPGAGTIPSAPKVFLRLKFTRQGHEHGKPAKPVRRALRRNDAGLCCLPALDDAGRGRRRKPRRPPFRQRLEPQCSH
jgi:hypothetical protein